MTIVESTRPITGGVDTHLDVHVAAAVDANGGVLGVESFATTPAGYGELCSWLQGSARSMRVGVEGTGAYGAGLGASSARRGPGGDRGRSSEPTGASPQRQVRRARRDRSGAGGVVGSCVRDREVRRWRRRGDPRVARGAPLGPQRAHQVLESDPPSRLHRSRRATRTAAGRAARPVGAHRGGVASHRGQRHRHVRDEAGDRDAGTARRRARDRRSRLDGCARHAWCAAARRACSRSTASASTPPRSCWSPPATTRTGCNSEAAFAHLCGVAPLPASSGKTQQRFRLNPGGNRQANHALWRIVFTRMSSDERTRKYVARRLAEGRSTREIMRILKRYVARELYPHLVRD